MSRRTSRTAQAHAYVGVPGCLRLLYTHTPNFSWPCSEARTFVTYARALPWADTSEFMLTVLMLVAKSTARLRSQTGFGF